MEISTIRVAAIACLFLHNYTFAATKEEALDVIDDMSIVLTPTRLKQSIADVPGSVTVISAEMLEKYGIRSVPEALRLVPGMMVTQISNSDYRINYHGSNIMFPRRLNVLIDGLSVYRSAFAKVDWTALPVIVDDIQRIEVTRGPNSASYGPNSMEAVVNIVTREPQAAPTVTARSTLGSRGLREGYVRAASSFGGNTNFRVSAEHEESLGFNQVTGFARTGSFPDHDSARNDRLSWRSITDLSTANQLETSFSMISGEQEQVATTQYQTTYPDVGLQEYDMGLTWHHTVSPNEDFKVQAYISEHRNREGATECAPRFAFLPELGQLWKANPDYVRAISAGRPASGGSAQDDQLLRAALIAVSRLGTTAQTPTCGRSNNDYTERRRDLEIEHTFVYSHVLRVVSGVGLRRDEAHSTTYLAGSVRNSAWRAFVNAEYHPTSAASINVGGFYQSDELTGSSFSPRIAFNHRLNANNTFRYVISRADRMPDIIEQRANWSYLVTGMAPALNASGEAYFVQSAIAKGNLEPEKMSSREIGYNANYPRLGLMVDTKLFDDQMSNLISETVNLNSFQLSNHGVVRLRGAEIQLDMSTGGGWSMHGGYTRLKNRTNDFREQTQYSKHSGMVAIAYVSESGWSTSLALYAAGAAPSGQSRYRREDIIFTKAIRLGRVFTVTPNVTISHLDTPMTTTVYDTGRFVLNGYDSSFRYTASLRVTF